MISAGASRRVTQSVALFEATKGGLVLLAGFGLLGLLHRDLHALAAALLGRFHLDPHSWFGGVFLEAADELTDARLWTLSAIAFLYSVFRLVEAYGLWCGRTWAEWLAVVSGAIYLPFEIYSLGQKFSWIKVSALTVNAAIVVVMLRVLRRNQRARHSGRSGP